MEKRIHVFFSGIVQGVGFRFSALALAKRYKLKGWVKNISDGRVELIAEGSNKDLNGFLGDLIAEFGRGITDCQLEKSEPKGERSDFKIAF